MIRIYDTSGRIVRAIETGPLAAGVHFTTWNGTDQAGHPLPGGIYFMKVAWRDREMVSRIVMLQ